MPMKSKCENCELCCLETEMIISHNNIELVLANSSYFNSKENFTYKINRKQNDLKIHDGYCVFFNPSLKICKIYKFRPNGCRFYPLIFDLSQKRVNIDDDCPEKNLFYNDKQELKMFVKI